MLQNDCALLVHGTYCNNVNKLNFIVCLLFPCPKPPVSRWRFLSFRKAACWRVRGSRGGGVSPWNHTHQVSCATCVTSRLLWSQRRKGRTSFSRCWRGGQSSRTISTLFLLKSIDRLILHKMDLYVVYIITQIFTPHSVLLKHV